MKIAYIDNKDSFADLLAGTLRLQGNSIDMYKDAIPENLEAYDYVLLGPGPNGPEDVPLYHEVLEKYKELHNPSCGLRGICLGMQTIAHSFGIPVQKVSLKHGKVADVKPKPCDLYKDLPKSIPLARYNSLGVLVHDMSPEFEVTGVEDDIVMSLRHKHKNIEAVQYHPESVLSGDYGKTILRRLFS
ncbi:MAG: glutamine amidotransferase-related protein [Candidatus Woesearchaeota archaeon]